MLKNKILMISGVLLTVGLVWHLSVWIVTAVNSAGTFEETVSAYLGKHPVWMRSPLLTTTVDIVIGSLAALCFFAVSKSSLPPTAGFARGFAFFNLLLVCWQLFSLL